MSAEPVQQVFTAGTPFDLTRTDTTAREEDQAIHAESTSSGVTLHLSSGPVTPILAWRGWQAPQPENTKAIGWPYDPDTGELLGVADTREELRRWRERDISVLFVEPRDWRAR